MEALKDLLSLVGVHVEIEDIEGWTLEQREQAEGWAATTHLRASDNDMHVPEKPGFLVRMDRLGEIKNTSRGFQYIVFKDRYGLDCSLQQSSLADNTQPGSSAVWLGTANGERMHLDVELVEKLLVSLNNWLDKGKL